MSAMVDDPLTSFSSSAGVSKLPHALLDDSVRHQSENIFETRWGLNIGNDMRMHVREMSSLRIINGEIMSESEKNDNKDIFKNVNNDKKWRNYVSGAVTLLSCKDKGCVQNI